jgi:hypothetical protein
MNKLWRLGKLLQVPYALKFVALFLHSARHFDKAEVT